MNIQVSEIREWAARGISGVRLDAAHSWPLILQPDTDELLRSIKVMIIYSRILEDSDGEYHYTIQQIMDGDIVQSSRTEGFHFIFQCNSKA